MKNRRPAVAFLAGVVALHTLASLSSAATFSFGDIPWPGNAEVATGPSTDPFTNSDRASSDPYTLSQTFKVDQAFDASSLFFSYRNKLPNSISTRVQIFEVADRFAASLPETVDPADMVYDQTIDSPSTLLDPINEPNGSRVVAQILLGVAVPLVPTTGSAGYAVRFTDLDASGEWRGYRKGGGNDIEGELYVDGNGYRNLTPRGFNRDYAVAVSSIATVIPEPSTGVLLSLLGASAGLARRRD